jgi:hypothetical protein
VALDRLEAALAVAGEAKVTEGKPLRNEPPRILFTEVPGILVSIDGEPVFCRSRARVSNAS